LSPMRTVIEGGLDVMETGYPAAMDWKDWCKLIGAIVFFSIGIWRCIVYQRVHRQNLN
jgi:hypothetical protein